MASEIADIERRRYIELCKQQALLGYSTPPEITLEIADLRQKYGPIELLGPVRHSIEQRRDLEVELLTAQINSLKYRQVHTERALRVVARNAYLVGSVAVVAALGLLGLLLLVVAR